MKRRVRGSRVGRAWSAALVLPAIVGVLAVLFGPSRSSGAAAGPRAVGRTDSAGVAFDAKTAWLAACATCHAPNGAGTRFGPSVQRSTQPLLDYELSTGRMPLPYGQRVPRRAPPSYTRPQIDALIPYILSVTGAPRGALPAITTDIARADVPRGGELFRLNCAACHTVTGVGGALLRREAPSLGASTATQTAEAVRTSPGAMPGFGTAALSDEELRDVVAYVQYLRAPNDAGGWSIGHIGPIAEGLVGFAVGTLGLLVVARMIGTRT